MSLQPSRWIALAAAILFAEAMVAGLLCHQLSKFPHISVAAANLKSTHSKQNDLDFKMNALRRRIGAIRSATSTVNAQATGVPTFEIEHEPALAGALNDPEFLHLLAIAEKRSLDGVYGRLFKQLNLSVGDLDRLKDLLVEKRLEKIDGLSAVPGGSASFDQYRQAVEVAFAECDAQIASLLGVGGFERFSRYEETQGTRAVVQALQMKLSAVGAPLTDDQFEQLVDVWAAVTPPALQVPELTGDTLTELYPLLSDFPQDDSDFFVDPVRFPSNASALAAAVLTPQQNAVVKFRERTAVQARHVSDR